MDEDYRFNEAEILVDIKNSIEQESTFSVLETIVLTRYKCNHCKEEFIIQGKPPRFCSNCGVKNEATIDIPVIEKSSCSLESMKKTNESSIKSIKEIVDNL